MKSYLMCAVWGILFFFRFLSLNYFIERHAWKCKKKETPPLFNEVYAIAWPTLIVFGLYLRWSTWFVVLCAYGLIELLLDVAQMLLGNYREDAQGHYLLIKHSIERGMVLVLFNIGQIILSFSVFYLFWGEEFEKIICGPLTALYHSTMATFFNGDATPKSWKAQVLVVTHLLYVFMFIAIRAPILFQSVRVKQKETDESGCG